ncbi:PREDICTED: zinc carboxypeptidase-like, partial [Priapulus caudatus]|uniref:Zinc carboxypeptidase-like n=1 Tax=Priapulus caudatus TaxID=37621 RepID=A0ABM1F646_PRICU
VAFLVWCMAPFKRNGAHVIYENVIKPFIKRREKGIDSTIDEIKEAAEDTLSSGKHSGSSRDRMWRKTRSPNPGNPCVGTDPNRNWDFHWMAGGASQRPCMETYAGSKPFSEVETKTVAEYLMRLNINGQVKVFLTVHTYSQMWLHPWGYTTTLPVDHEDLAALGNRATAALTAVHGTTYVVGSSAVVL